MSRHSGMNHAPRSPCVVSHHLGRGAQFYADLRPRPSSSKCGSGCRDVTKLKLEHANFCQDVPAYRARDPPNEFLCPNAINPAPRVLARKDSVQAAAVAAATCSSR